MRDLIKLLIIAVVLWLAYCVRAILLPVFIGLALAYIFGPIVKMTMTRFNVSRTLATSMMMSVMFLGLGVAGAWLGPTILREGVALSQRLPEYFDKLGTQVKPILIQSKSDNLNIYKRFNQIFDLNSDNDSAARVPYRGTDPEETMPGRSAQTQPELEQPVRDDVTVDPPAAPRLPPIFTPPPLTPLRPPDSQASIQIKPSTQPALTPVAAAATTQPAASQPAVSPVLSAQHSEAQNATTVTLIVPAASTQPGMPKPPATVKIDWKTAKGLVFSSLNVGVDAIGTTIVAILYFLLAIIIAVASFYVFSCRLEQLVPAFTSCVSPEQRPKVLRILDRMDGTISAIVRGRVIQAAVMSVILIGGWYVAGVPYYLILGLLCGLLHLAPFAAAVGLPAVILLTWLDRSIHGESLDFWFILFWPSVVYFSSQLIDSWLVEPMVQSRATNLNPLTIFLSVLIGTSLFGLTGMLLAIPFVACARIVWEELVVRRDETHTEEVLRTE